MTNQNINVALIGNPNTGKTSVFNQLTGLNQQVGNYPELRLKKIDFANYPIMPKLFLTYRNIQLKCD
jgi:ferrous iron transport protein B